MLAKRMNRVLPAVVDDSGIEILPEMEVEFYPYDPTAQSVVYVDDSNIDEDHAG